MQPDPFTEQVPNTEIKDYIDIIKRRLESFDHPLLKMKYSPEIIVLVKGTVNQQLRTLEMYYNNNFMMYRWTFDGIKKTISNSFRTLKMIR